MPALLDSARPVLESCRETTAALADIIPENQFWKWKEMWQNSLRNAVFSAVLVEYLHSGGLLSLPAVSETLGSTCNPLSFVVQQTHLLSILQSVQNGKDVLYFLPRTTCTELFPWLTSW